jgi:ankyrin repeat protein
MEPIALFILPGSSDDAEDNSDPDSDLENDGNDIGSKKQSQPQSKNIGAISLPVRPASMKEVTQRVCSGLQPSTLKRIWIGKNVNEYDKKGLTPLHKSIKSGDIKLVNLLLAAGADPNAGEGMRPLKLGYPSVVESIRRVKSIDINAKEDNYRKRTALLISCENGHLDIVKLLLDRGDIDIKAVDADNCNALLLACRHGYLATVKLLLDRGGFDVNVKMELKDPGSTALIISARYSQSKILKELLKHKGMDFNAKDNERKTAFMYACSSEKQEDARLFLEIPEVDFDAKDKQGRMALMYACENAHLDVVQKLRLRKPEDIYAVDDKGITCLM